MIKKEFHYIYAGEALEYSLRFELMSFMGRTFFSKKPLIKNGYCNLGCGPRVLTDFVNADFYQFNLIRKILKKSILKKKIDWEIDLRFKLKCDNNFFSGVLVEHVIEHLKILDALRLLKEINRILKPGGLLRISVPDLKLYIDYYNGIRVHKKFSGWDEIRGEAIWSLNHNFGHQSVYDAELLSDLILKAGFEEVRKCSFNNSRDAQLRVDDIGRSWESLYIEAKK